MNLEKKDAVSLAAKKKGVVLVFEMAGLEFLPKTNYKSGAMAGFCIQTS